MGAEEKKKTHGIACCAITLLNHIYIYTPLNTRHVSQKVSDSPELLPCALHHVIAHCSAHALRRACYTQPPTRIFPSSPDLPLSFYASYVTAPSTLVSLHAMMQSACSCSYTLTCARASPRTHTFLCTFQFT